nr:hypothetical protein [uncultured Agathobacter sp.]
MELFLDKRNMFFCGLILYVFRSFFSYTSYPVPIPILTFLWYGAIFCWVLAIIMRFEWNPLIIIELCAVAYGFFSYKITGSTNILAIILILLSSKEIECRDIIDVLFKVTAPLMGFSIVWYGINFILGNAVVTKTREINGTVSMRHSFYFNHANGFSLYFLFICLMFFYLYYKNINKKILYLVLLCGGAFIYIFPNTRTVAIVLVLVILFDILINLQSSFAVRFICKNLFIIGLAMVLVLAVAYLNNPDLGILKKIDDFMNGRLTMIAGAYDLYGINLSGHKIINEEIFLPKLGYFTLYIDNFWGMLLIRYGLISSALVGIIAIYTSYSLDKHGEKLDLILMAAIFLFGLSESTALDIFPVFPWLFFKETGVYKYLEERP